MKRFQLLSEPITTPKVSLRWISVFYHHCFRTKATSRYLPPVIHSPVGSSEVYLHWMSSILFIYQFQSYLLLLLHLVLVDLHVALKAMAQKLVYSQLISHHVRFFDSRS